MAVWHVEDILKQNGGFFNNPPKFQKKPNSSFKKSYYSHDGKKQMLAERETFSDEDSDEGDYDFEELFEVPKKKKAKRKCKANEVTNPKRFRPTPKP